MPRILDIGESIHQKGFPKMNAKRTQLNRRSMLALLLAILVIVLTVTPGLAQSRLGNTTSTACEFLSADQFPLRGEYLTPAGPWVVRMADGGLLGYEGGLMALRDCYQR
jgi:hypothetical protein